MRQLILLAMMSTAAWAQPAPQHGTAKRVSIPTVPTFEFRAGAAGTAGVREQMLAGEKGKDAKVSGYVVWIYSCIDAVRTPGESVAQAQKRIDDDPTQCERPKFYLADEQGMPVEQGMWVVDVPRQYNKLETLRIQKKDRNFPDRCEKNAAWKAGYCFPLAVGDYVTVTGMWTTTSPHGESNSDGLIVFKSLAKATPTVGKMIAPPPKSSTVKPVVVKRVTVAGTAQQQKASEQFAATGDIAFRKRDYKAAQAAYESAVKAWPGNHEAYYNLASVKYFQDDSAGGFAAASRALELSPTTGMYALSAGKLKYDVLVQQYKQEQARKTNVPVKSVTEDLTAIDFSSAEAYFRLAVSLDTELFSAHYYLGRIARDQGHVQEAATEFSLALQEGPAEAAPWVALGNLYLKWGFADLAQRIEEQAVQIVPDASDVYLMLGMAHDAQHHDLPAVEAFNRAVQADASNGKALFMRGQVLYRLKRFAEARVDLEAFLASRSTNAFTAQQATKLLASMPTKKAR